MSILDRSVKDCKRHLSAKLIDLDAVGAHAPVHNVLPTRELHIPLLQTKVRGIVSLDNLVQRDRELLPPFLGVRATLLFGSQRAVSVCLRYPIPVGHCR